MKVVICPHYITVISKLFLALKIVAAICISVRTSGGKTIVLITVFDTSYHAQDYDVLDITTKQRQLSNFSTVVSET